MTPRITLKTDTSGCNSKKIISDEINNKYNLVLSITSTTEYIRIEMIVNEEKVILFQYTAFA